jgi:hypothetical protein
MLGGRKVTGAYWAVGRPRFAAFTLPFLASASAFPDIVGITNPLAEESVPTGEAFHLAAQFVFAGKAGSRAGRKYFSIYC